MSIMMAGRARRTNGDAEADSTGLDEGLRALLDHVAVELAEEYVRLMEASVEADSTETAADQAR